MRFLDLSNQLFLPSPPNFYPIPNKHDASSSAYVQPLLPPSTSLLPRCKCSLLKRIYTQGFIFIITSLLSKTCQTLRIVEPSSLVGVHSFNEQAKFPQMGMQSGDQDFHMLLESGNWSIVLLYSGAPAHVPRPRPDRF